MGRYHLLIVDDDESIAAGLRDGLRVLSDCDITIATSGEHALRLLQQQPFHLLITDYQMPGIDGLTLARQAHQIHPHTAIIMLTACCTEGLQEKANQAAVQYVMRKPTPLAEIRRAVVGSLVTL